MPSFSERLPAQHRTAQHRTAQHRTAGLILADQPEVLAALEGAQ